MNLGIVILEYTQAIREVCWPAVPRPDQLKQPQIRTLQCADLNRNNFFLAMQCHGLEWSEVNFISIHSLAFFMAFRPQGSCTIYIFISPFFTPLLGSLHRRYAIDILCYSANRHFCERPNSLSRFLDFLGGLIGNYRHLPAVYIEVECATAFCLSVIYTREPVTVRGTS